MNNLGRLVPPRTSPRPEASLTQHAGVAYSECNPNGKNTLMPLYSNPLFYLCIERLVAPRAGYQQTGACLTPEWVM